MSNKISPVYVKLTNDSSDNNKPTDNKQSTKNIFQRIDVCNFALISFLIVLASTMPILLICLLFDKYNKESCYRNLN